MSEKHKNWFVNWFDSPYYHLLYKHRNHSEAEYFISNLFEYLKEEKGNKILDLACGKGRHALQVYGLGYDVTGVDLSVESIKAAKSFQKEMLQFEEGDMRNLRFKNHFNLVLNLFTSFGYFQKEGDNIKVLQSITESLKKDGRLVLDYLNVKKVIDTLPQEEEKEREGIVFRIEKKIEDSFIVKEINFEAEGRKQHYQEFVKLFDLNSFKEILEKCGMKVTNTFGDYHLNAFDEETSDRLIIIAQK